MNNDIVNHKNWGLKGEHRDKDVFLNLLQTLCQAETTCVLLSRSMPSLPKLTDRSFRKHSFSYMQFVIEGELSLTYCSAAGRICQRTLLPGDSFFSVPGSWDMRDQLSARKLLALAFYPDQTGLILSDYKPGPNTPDSSLESYFTDSRLCNVGTQLLQAFQSCLAAGGSDADAAMLKNALLHFLINQIRQEDTPASGGDQRLWRTIEDYLSRHITHALTRETVAARFNIHPDSLSRLFRKHAENSFNSTINHMRLDLSMSLLSETREPISTIAEQCGFCSESYFIRRFRQAYGKTPGQFRRDV